MVKKYILVRMPIEAYKGFTRRKCKMEKSFKSWTGKEIKIPMTRVYIESANNPVEIHEDKIIKLVKRKIRRVEK